MAHYLSLRANWQQIAADAGGKFEKVVFKILSEHFAATAPSYTVVSHPSDFSQLWLEEDYKNNPTDYVKPKDQVKGDIYYDESKKIFLSYNGSKWVPAKMGIVPDLMITNKTTGRRFLIEAKHQNDKGNAHERCAKFATPSMIEALKKNLGVEYHPIAYMFGGPLVDKRKYQLELRTCYAFAGANLVLVKEGPEMVDQILNWFEQTVKPMV